MRIKNLLFLMVAGYFHFIAHAHIDLESAKNIITQQLAQDYPACVAEFNNFCKRYDEVVGKFFSKKNKDSLKMHINRMEQELNLLKNVCEDARYASVRSILCDYHTNIGELILLLKEYIGSHDTIALAFKVREFKRILPPEVRQRGDIALFWALHHRLRCE